MGQLPPDMHRDRLLTRGMGGFTLAKTLRGGQDADTQRNCGALGMTAGGLGGFAALPPAPQNYGAPNPSAAADSYNLLLLDT
jgi:hypothetical protein